MHAFFGGYALCRFHHVPIFFSRFAIRHLFFLAGWFKCVLHEFKRDMSMVSELSAMYLTVISTSPITAVVDSEPIARCISHYFGSIALTTKGSKDCVFLRLVGRKERNQQEIDLRNANLS